MTSRNSKHDFAAALRSPALACASPMATEIFTSVKERWLEQDAQDSSASVAPRKNTQPILLMGVSLPALVLITASSRGKALSTLTRPSTKPEKYFRTSFISDLLYY